MRIQLIEVGRDKVPVIQNLARFYVYDLSEIAGYPCPESGLFGARDDDFWGDRSNHFFVIRVDSELAGFAVADSPEDDAEADWNIAEFFVLRKFRRKEVGKYAAHWLFDRFKGNWRVMEMLCNEPAIAFWRKIISDYTSGDFMEAREIPPGHSEEFIVQRFTSKSSA